MILEKFKRGGEMHPPLPTMAQISKIVIGAYVTVGIKRTSGYDVVDVRVTGFTKSFSKSARSRFTGIILGQSSTPIEFGPENIREIEP